VLIRELHTLAFLDAAHNRAFIGGPSTGKTHLATALGVEAIGHNGQRVRFFSTIELVNKLELESRRQAGTAGKPADACRSGDS
jgi:DNA replication protein DnaC